MNTKKLDLTKDPATDGALTFFTVCEYLGNQGKVGGAVP